jgi:vitamin B12 transporter
MHSAEGVGALFSIFDVSLVENVAFFSGGFGAKYGDALSGVLDVKTRNGNKTNYSGNILLSLAGFNMKIEGPIIKNYTSFIFTGRKNYSSLILKQQGRADNYEVFPYYWDFSGKIAQKINKYNFFELFYFEGTDSMVYKIIRNDYQGDMTWSSDQEIINFRYTSFISSKWYSELSISKNLFNNEYKLTNSIWSKNKLSQYYLRWDQTIKAHARHKIETGLEVKNQKLYSSGYYPENEYEWTTPDSLWKIYQSDVLGTKFGAYFQDQIELGDNLFSTIGVRGDYFDKIQASTADLRVSLAYALDSSTIIKASTGTYHQFPYLEYLMEMNSNSKLKPMLAYHYCIGVEKKFKFGLSTNLELYYKKYKNLILKNEKQYYSNQGYGRGKGVELLIQKTGGDFTGWLSYSYSLSRRKELDFTEVLPANYDIPHNLTLNCTIKLPWDLELGTKYRFASGRPYTPVVGADYNPEKNVYYPKYGQKQAERYHDYMRLDLRLSKALFYKKLAVFIFFELGNAFNHKNVIKYDYSEDYSTKTPFTLMDRLYFIGLIVVF